MDKKKKPLFGLDRKALGEMVRFAIDVNIAWTVGYIAGFVFNYYMSARYIFREKASIKNGAGFGGAHIVNYLLQMVLLNVFVKAGVSPSLAPVGVYAISIPVNFLLVRFVFKHS